MSRFMRIFTVLFLAFWAGTGLVRAQEYYDIQLMVTNTADENKPFDEVMVYMFETEAEGRKAAHMWEDAKRANKETGVFYFDPSAASSDATMKDLRGTSWPAILKDVSSTGAVLITTELGGFPYKLEMVKGRRELKVALRVEQVEMLDAATLKASHGPRAPITPPVDRGDTISLRKHYLFPQERMGKKDARFVMQSFILPPGGGTDTLEFRKSVVMDGRDYHATQLRRMGYDGKNDPLYGVASQCPVLTDSTDHAVITDKIIKGKKTKGGLIMANIWFEDYNHVYFQDTIEVEDLRRLARPMQFLEYSVDAMELDAKDPLYKKDPRVVKMDTELDLSINFAVGKATIDPKDTASIEMLGNLKSLVYSVTHTPGSEMRGYKIFGVASPEGTYARNIELARERMRYIKHEVDAEIPASATIHFKAPPTADASVATWAQLADTLAKDSAYIAYADEIRDIVERFPGSLDVQGSKIRVLPFYQTVVKDNLARLRKVTFSYSQSVHRAMTVEEMFDKLRHDPLFMEGGTNEQFMPYEFWVMLQHATDTTELEKICRRAIAQDMRMQSRKEFRWPLPANILAASALKRGICDTTILAPYIFEEEGRCNRPYTLGENKALLNPIPVVANQVAMMLKGEYYTRALQLAMLFKDSGDPALEQLFAITRCKAGYFDSVTEEGRRYYELVRATSPRNAVVMDMATYYLAEVPDYLDQLDQEDPITDYLRAQYYCIQYFTDSNDNSFNMMEQETQYAAVRALMACFQKDPKYMEVADSDWFIFKGLFEKTKMEMENPGSFLPPDAPEVQEITEEDKARIMQLGDNGEFDKMTEAEQDLYFKWLYGG